MAYAIGRPVGTAVVRNRLRRRLREVIRRHAGLLEPGCAYLFAVGAGAVTMTPTDLDRLAADLLHRVRSS